MHVGDDVMKSADGSCLPAYQKDGMRARVDGRAGASSKENLRFIYIHESTLSMLQIKRHANLALSQQANVLIHLTNSSLFC